MNSFKFAQIINAIFYIYTAFLIENLRFLKKEIYIWKHLKNLYSILLSKSNFCKIKNMRKTEKNSISQSKLLRYLRGYTYLAVHQNTVINISRAQRRFQGSHRRISWGLQGRGCLREFFFYYTVIFYWRSGHCGLAKGPRTSITLLLAFFAAAHLRYTSAPHTWPGVHIRFATLLREG